MAAITAEALERLADMIAEYQAEITIPEAWPLALGYGPWVEEVWTNYISNGLKYGGDPPQIELGATIPEELGDQVRFWVRDNGAGLLPEDQARLFTPFAQIHRARAKGHGLGLSIVQRIAAKFFFTLPSRES
jgi:signal transduction histidine kinase